MRQQIDRGRFLLLLGVGGVLGCTGPDDKGGNTPFVHSDSGDGTSVDSGDSDTAIGDTGIEPCEPPDYGEPGDPFADLVVDYVPGGGAGFGQDDYPDIVLGPPLGGGANSGSLDVLSLGEGGEIVLEFTDRQLYDGEGIDLLVFENPFSDWVEPVSVAASTDGIVWNEWNCDLEDSDYIGCAGVNPVLSHPDNCINATDPSVAGGDGFDLADIGMEMARFVRIRDLEVTGPGGFDLDAVGVVHGIALER